MFKTKPLYEDLMPNPEKNYTAIATGIVLVAMALIFLPGWIGMDGMDGGYALSFIAVWLAISAVLVAWYFWGRAAQIDRMLAGQGLLAHWTYTSAEWQTYADAEQQQQIEENRALWLLIAGMCVLMGVVFWLIDRQAGLFVLLFMLALTLLLAVVAFGLPRLRRQRQAGKTGEAWLAPTAVFFDDVFYPLKSKLMWLKDVEWKEASGNTPACLHFRVAYFMRTGVQTKILRVPVPDGCRDEGLALLEQYKSQI
jgi:hypothetical protein